MSQHPCKEFNASLHTPHSCPSEQETKTVQAVQRTGPHGSPVCTECALSSLQNQQWQNYQPEAAPPSALAAAGRQASAKTGGSRAHFSPHGIKAIVCSRGHADSYTSAPHAHANATLPRTVMEHQLTRLTEQQGIPS